MLVGYAASLAPRIVRRLKCAAFFGAICTSWLVTGAQNEPAAPQGNNLTQFSNMDAKDTAAQLTLLQQELYQEELSTAIIRFTLQYGNTVHLESVNFPSTGLEVIPGYVFTPTNLQSGKKYPGIVFVHGGFHDRLDTYFFKMIATAVSKGYVVMFPDYRGSSGYGDIHYANSYGTTDVADVLASADFLGKLSYVDPDRLGIVGHSRGGMVTLLAIEQAPKKFKVATEIAGLVDFIAYMSYKPDWRRSEVAREPQFHGMGPDKNLGAYIKVSPMSHVKDIETPLLVLANTFDETVPLDLHSGRLIDLLKGDGKVYESHIYTDAPGGHMFPFADTEEGRDVFARVFEWTGKYLKP
jgi:dipeptidyl aminopeptidase/acylaminoacyl peptidase